jgi:GMP synthase (glutamine-hydrolysing)
MPNILIAEGTPALWQTEHAGFAIPSNFSLFAAAVQLHDPGIRCTLINIADGGALPSGTALSDFDGVMIPGSPLHIYDPTPAVARQIDFARATFATRVPVWGSCWGTSGPIRGRSVTHKGCVMMITSRPLVIAGRPRIVVG